MQDEWTSPDGRIRLINADCLAVLPHVEADALVTDPPYGIGEAAGKAKTRTSGLTSTIRNADEYRRDYGDESWDDEPLPQTTIDAIRAAAKWQIIFGGNYYSLPPTSCWLVWDKMNGATDFADCELAWTNLRKAVRRLQYLWNGCMRRERHIPRQHPTQKPVGVMEWAMSHLPPVAETILDPFAGSCTTAIACIRTNRRCIAIEKERKYWEIGVQRCKAEYARTVLFNEAEAVA
jgi:DNA modification methylase